MAGEENLPLAETPWYKKAWDVVTAEEPRLVTDDDGKAILGADGQLQMAAAQQDGRNLVTSGGAFGSRFATAGPDGKPQYEAPKPPAAVPDSTPQGPEGDDGFPTYRDLGAGSPAAQPQMMAAGPQRTIAAHWQPGTRAETVQHGVDAEAMRPGQEYRDEAHIQGGLANQGRLAAAEQQGMADAVYAASHAAASKQAGERVQAIENEKRMYVQAEQEKLNTLSIAAQEKVDPEAAKGSSGAQLVSALAIALGQFGASINGGPNAALQIVNANIDRRIAAQRDNIGNAGKAHDREMSLYKQNLEAFGDKERATLATKVQYLDQAKAMADQQYAASKHSMNEANYNAVNEKLLNERADTLDKFAMVTADKRTSQSNESFKPAMTVGGAGAAGAGAKGKEALFVPMLGGYARTKEEAEKLRAKTAMMATINEQSHKIHGLLEEAKGLSTVTDYGRMQEIRGEIRAAKHASLVAVTVAGGQGAISKDDKVISEARTAMEDIDPQLKTTAQIDRMKKGLISVVKSNMTETRLMKEGSGIQLGSEQYVQGQNGPESRAVLSGHNATVTKRSEGHTDVIEGNKGVSTRK